LCNPYLILEIEFGASDDDIAKAYKKLMLQLHPDKQPVDQLEEEAEEVSRRFHVVMGAKSFLLDGEHLASRREYDARLVAKEKANAAAAAREAAQAKTQARQAALAKTQQQKQKQQQSAPSSPQSPSVKVHPASKTKATTKSTTNKVEPSKGGINKTEDTSKKQNITKKQWGRVSRPARESTTTTKIERKSSCSTTSDDSSDEEAGPQHDRTKSRRETSSNIENIEHKSSNTTRSKHNNKQKKSQSSSDKPRKDSRKDSSSKKTFTKVKEKSHAISQKAKKPSGTDKSTSTKKNSNKGSNLTDSKSSSPKKVSKTECTKKQRCKSESANHKLSASCPSLFDDDDKKGRSISFERKSSVDGKTHANNTPSKAVPSSSHTPPKPTKTTLTPPAAPKASAPSSFATFQPAVETLTKQYRCPLTKEVMKEPMSDFEGNNYEKDAILKYLETHSTSPVTGNPLFPLHLTANSALKERIKYTLKLKNCLDALSK
jgi:curved DNA-binding protein CbpA